MCWDIAGLRFLRLFDLFHPAGYNGVRLRQKGPSSSRSRIPIARRSQTSSAATQGETHQLYSASEPGHSTFIANYTVQMQPVNNNNNKKNMSGSSLKKNNNFESVFVSKADYGWLDLNKACV